jgi:hypothetical protein
MQLSSLPVIVTTLQLVTSTGVKGGGGCEDNLAH